MVFDIPPDPPKFWLPPKPAIIRSASDYPRRAPLLAHRLRRVSGGGPPVSLTYIGSNSSNTNASSYNLGDFNAPTAGLMIVAAFGNVEQNRPFSSISIGGSAGTIHASADHTGGSDRPRTAIASRVVSSGNNNVTLTFGGNQYHGGAAVWLLTGYQSATPNDTDSAALGSVTSRTLTLDILSGGCAIYVAGHENGNAHSWSTATSRYDAAVETARYSGADRIVAGTAHGEVVSWTTAAVQSACAAAWR